LDAIFLSGRFGGLANSKIATDRLWIDSAIVD